VLYAHGAAADLAPLVPEIADVPSCYLSVQPEFVGLLRSNDYAIRDEKKMWRMVMDPARFDPPPHTAVRLGLEDLEGLADLYRDGDAAGESPQFFDAGMLRHGVYAGIRVISVVVAGPVPTIPTGTPAPTSAVPAVETASETAAKCGLG
jgi:hypothetical protein